MIGKEGTGRALKKAARIIPGIGSYQDKESLREADKELRGRLSRRLDEHLESIEWLKASLAKNGAYKNLDELETLTRHFEKVSRMIERASRGYAPVFSERPVDEAALERLYEHDKGMWELIAIVDSAVQSVTADKAVPGEEDIDHIRSLLNSIEKKVKERDEVLKNAG